MRNEKSVEFTRYKVPIDIFFQGNHICCEWCSMSFINMKRHYECSVTHEEMVSPSDSIGFRCPLRDLEEFK